VTRDNFTTVLTVHGLIFDTVYCYAVLNIGVGRYWRLGG